MTTFALGLATVLVACGASRGSVMPSDPDRDRIVADVDRCPDDPERYNGFQDDDGCPDRPPADRGHCVWTGVLQILERVEFADGSAHVRTAALPVLEVVAATVLGNPSLERVAIVGSRTGREPAGLAADRATAVATTLAQLGVPGERVTARAYPADHGMAAAPHERAVWFVALRIDGDDVTPTEAARWLPWRRDCAGSWRAWRDTGALVDCDCLDHRPPEVEAP